MRGTREAQETGALGRSKGGLTTKIHMVIDVLDDPLRVILTPGQASDYTQASPLLQDLPAHYVLSDKGYDSSQIVEAIEKSGATARDPAMRLCEESARNSRRLCTPSDTVLKASSTGSNTTGPLQLATPNAHAPCPPHLPRRVHAVDEMNVTMP